MEKSNFNENLQKGNIALQKEVLEKLKEKKEEELSEKEKVWRDQFIKAEELRDSNLLFAVGKVKSVHRAMRRGRITPMGNMIAKRPFNNRKNTCKRKGHTSRLITKLKVRDYESAKRIAAKQSL